MRDDEESTINKNNSETTPAKPKKPVLDRRHTTTFEHVEAEPTKHNADSFISTTTIETSRRKVLGDLCESSDDKVIDGADKQNLTVSDQEKSLETDLESSRTESEGNYPTDFHLFLPFFF